MLASLFNYIPQFYASGLFETLKTGGNNLKGYWDIVATFFGAIVIIVAIVFTVMAVMKTRDKGRWGWYAALAWIVGGILLVSGMVNTIQGNFSDTWNEVFGTAIFYTDYVKVLLGI